MLFSRNCNYSFKHTDCFKTFHRCSSRISSVLRGANLDYRISLIGLFIGFLVGLTGMGGGALLAPIMILVLRVPPVWAVGTDMTYSAVTKAFGSIIHCQQK